jgi:hypothetical protein
MKADRYSELVFPDRFPTPYSSLGVNWGVLIIANGIGSELFPPVVQIDI